MATYFVLIFVPAKFGSWQGWIVPSWTGTTELFLHCHNSDWTSNKQDRWGRADSTPCEIS
eukprot:3999781-Amphidinium_carterae.1